MLDWSQTFGKANFQTFGKATGVVTVNLGPINWVYPWWNRSTVLRIPPILLLCGWFCGLGICDPHLGMIFWGWWFVLFIFGFRTFFAFFFLFHLQFLF